MAKIYLANIWDELLSEKGLRLLERDFVIGGNWLSGKRNRTPDEFYPDLIVYAQSCASNAISFPVSVFKEKRIITWILFPDCVLGWDFQKNKFKNNVSKKTLREFKLSDILLTNSNYTKNLIGGVVHKKTKFSNCYLGIDFDGIERVRLKKQSQSTKTSILWNHMWRIDKNFQEVLRIFKKLAPKYPSVDFIIGRENSWADKEYSPPWLKNKYHEFLNEIKTKKIENIHITKTYPTANEYWSFITNVNISLSLSFHETFGLSMLEQAAAGSACILPRGIVYDEIFENYEGLVDRKDVVIAIENAISNCNYRMLLQKESILYARRFDIENTINDLKIKIKQLWI